MSPKVSQQHAVTLPNGVRIDRLPLGFADECWWLFCVFTGPGRWARALDKRDDFFRVWLPGTVQLYVPDGDFHGLRSGGVTDQHRGGGDLAEAEYRFEAMPWVGIRYLYEGETVDEEHLDLSRH